ncbi:MAG: PilZ domain-containing protein [Methylovirgula sp.]
MQEHRTTERVRSFLRAQIVFNNRMTTIECIIKNYSAAGAKIALNDTLTVPTEFDIYIPAKQRNHHARLVWRDKDAIGVNFIEAGAAVATKTPAAAAADRLRELELQNAELKSRVRELSKRLEDLGQDPNIAA